ncbi:MAG: hypothetical protein HYZ52_07255 [Candidatus Omnitrophica bacterium]|nr:hypothetical protein [Candidatus Omnitrophota bacterium]
MDKFDQTLENYFEGAGGDAAFARKIRGLVENLDEAGKEKIPRELVEAAKRLGGRKPAARRRLSNFLWAGFSVVMFAFSFLFRRYFLQCLALAVVSGIKWIVDQRVTKTQIMIYKALETEEKEGERHRLSSHL